MHQATFWARLRLAATAVSVGAIIALSCFGIVRAERRLSYNTCTSSGYCLVWQNTSSGGAIEAQATSGNGLYSTTSSTSGNSAVAGIANNTTGSAHGVFGRSSNGQGVYGTSSRNNGVEGHTSSAQDYAGVAGYGDGHGAGVSGESGGGGSALRALSDDDSTDIFAGHGKTNGASCIVDGRANLTCTGKITGKKALRVRHRNSGGEQVLAYASESASPAIEDAGTARMFAGVANVAIDPAFASVMDRNSPYYVFVTPLGDTRGLYVSAKTPSGFQVREIAGGRSRLDFDYRIVAHPLDATKDRLPTAPPTATLAP